MATRDMMGNIMVASSILNVVNRLVFINPFATLTEHSKLFYTTCCIHPIESIEEVVYLFFYLFFPA